MADIAARAHGSTGSTRCSDQPLFAALDNTVAVNADPDLEAAARATYRGDDLRDAYHEGRQLLDNT